MSVSNGPLCSFQEQINDFRRKNVGANGQNNILRLEF